jgi:hypothetical protein
LLAVFVTAAIAGCQPSVGATATGAVTFNGKPAPAGVMVTFQPQVANSSASIGVTDAAGRYDLRFNARIRGVMPGESIVSLAIVTEPDAEGKTSVPDVLKGVRIPPSYGAKSTLRKTVNPGTNVIDIDIDL